MPEETHYYTRNVEVQHLITKDIQKALIYRPGPGFNRIIRSNQVRLNSERCCIIGGSDEEKHDQETPAILIEKEGDIIRRIYVTCPCGRKAELVWEDNETTP